jgi:hypothetical protein
MSTVCHALGSKHREPENTRVGCFNEPLEEDVRGRHLVIGCQHRADGKEYSAAVQRSWRFCAQAREALRIRRPKAYLRWQECTTQ